MDPRALRADIPALEEAIYLNTGASGPVPTRVQEAATDRLEYQTVDAPRDGTIYEGAFDTYEAARKAAASHLGATPETIGLTESTADGIGQVAAAIDWEPGDVIVRTDTEHPAGVLPWERLRREHDVEVRVVETTNGHVPQAAFKQAVKDARLVCLSSVCWKTGAKRAVSELTDIAHDAGARVLVDAVQSVGQHAIDISDLGVDVLAASTHKWPMGLWGGGFLYVEASLAADLVPAQIGYRGVEEPSAETYELKPGPQRFEVGTSSPVPYAAAEEALGIIEELGYDTITNRIQELAGRLIEALPAERVRSPQPPESGLVAVAVPDADQTVAYLAEEDIRIRALPGSEVVRVSIHAFNTPADIDTAADALAATW